MKRTNRDLLVAFVVFASLILLFMFLSRPSSSSRSFSNTLSSSGPKIGLIEILGPIYDSRKWVDEIDDFRTQKNIKAIVVRIDSPGGAVAASQELYEALKRARSAKPVIASFGNVAASGGYYAAMGADTIVANVGSTTGSIGVIIHLTQWHELYDKIGISTEVVKSGKFKDSGSPTRELRPDERAYFQSYIDDSYEIFAEVVAEERKLSLKEVKKLADGRVYTGRQAFESGLIDVLGDQYEAIQIAAKMANISGTPEIVKPPKKKNLELLDYLLEGAIEKLGINLEGQNVFQYRWKAESQR
jgi:protease IV